MAEAVGEPPTLQGRGGCLVCGPLDPYYQMSQRAGAGDLSVCINIPFPFKVQAHEIHKLFFLKALRRSCSMTAT